MLRCRKGDVFIYSHDDIFSSSVDTDLLAIKSLSKLAMWRTQCFWLIVLLLYRRIHRM